MEKPKRETIDHPPGVGFIQTSFNGSKYDELASKYISLSDRYANLADKYVALMDKYIALKALEGST